MKHLKTHLLFLTALLVSGLALGEDFWVKKDYTQWTDEDVRKILKDSPWAKEVIVTAPPGAGLDAVAPASNRSIGGIDAENSAPAPRGGRGGRGARGGDTGENSGPPAVLLTLNISWRSALPLRKALAKNRADLQGTLDHEDENYVIVLSGLPARMTRAIQNSEELKQSTLRRGRKPPIRLAAVDVSPHTQTVDVIFAFPRTERITAEDKDVEVVLKVAQLEVKKKFSLKEMVYNGKLEL
jgi:hypothetical protein